MLEARDFLDLSASGVSTQLGLNETPSNHLNVALEQVLLGKNTK